MTRRLARVASLVAPLAAASLFFAENASASESYPNAVERALDAPCPPDCTTCHTTRKGGSLTANTPVGISARRAGLEGGDTGLLLDVLATLEANATDSDMDGTPDVEEIRTGTNPNALEGKLECYEPPADEGCAVSACAAKRNGAEPWPLAVVLALAGLAIVRSVRRSQSQ